MRSRPARHLGALSLAALLALPLTAPAAASPAAHDTGSRHSAHAAAASAEAFRSTDVFTTSEHEEFQEVAATPDLRFACPSGRVPANGLTDTGEPFAAAIDWLLWYGVTQGRTPTTSSRPAR